MHNYKEWQKTNFCWFMVWVCKARNDSIFGTQWLSPLKSCTWKISTYIYESTYVCSNHVYNLIML